MKKTLVILAILFLFTAALVSAMGSEKRYLVKSNNGLLKASTNVMHEFNNGFSAELTQGKKKALEALGVELEEIPLYQVLAKPVCGDGICQGKESRTCPADCSSTPDPEEPRTCIPEMQIPYGIQMVNGGQGGLGVKVAVLDTGVNINHLDLEVKLCMDATKRGIKSGCNDEVGHGTHVSGTIAANGGSDGLGIFGVAPAADLWNIKVCSAAGCWSDDIAAAIRYTTDQGTNIISMSLGGDTESSLVRDAIDYAVSKDVLVVAATGNDGPELGSIDYPGANANVVAVAAVDWNANIASWSSRGINDNDFVVEEREVELAAPGVSVLSTASNGCYAVMSGTSMATPHVAGLAAKLWQGSAASTRAYLQTLALDIDALGDDPASGFGLPIAP
ncbi:MAG: S8 family serine peptidase [Nanoarchaeota archaeon]|nr:S8 family serine peptidase [Nanoarchaeota archaeon]